MAKKYETLRSRMSPAARDASAVDYSQLIEMMPLFELRQAIELTQAEVAKELHMGQGDISKLEHRTDMYVSTLAPLSAGHWRGPGDPSRLPGWPRRPD